MCRWFVYLGEEATLLEDVLVTPKHAITRQVHDHFLPGLLETYPADEQADAKRQADLHNRLFNIDGYGVAFYTNTASQYGDNVTGPRPVLYKSVSPALTDPVFRSLCANSESTCVVSHIRAATATAVETVNNHPFVFGRHSICHNGVVANFAKIRRQMCALMSENYFLAMRGTTDSEHLAALYMTHLGDENSDYTVQQMRDALAKTVGEIHRLQDKICPDLDNVSSLNVCVTDGQQVCALRWLNSAKEEPPSLYLSTTAGVILNRKYKDNKQECSNLNDVVQSETAKNSAKQPNGDQHAPHVIIASEPTTFTPDDWKLIDKNHAVLVDRNLKLSVEAFKI